MFRLILANPIVFLIGILIVCLFGAVSVFRIPIQMIPDVSPRVVSVETVWPGATPQDVEQEILVEQEKHLRRIPGLVRLASNAEFGTGSVELEFPPGLDINEALIRINNALSQVTGYPDTVDEPRIVAESVSDDPFLYFGVERLPGRPDASASNAQDVQRETNWVETTLRPRLERVPGVSNVRVIGGAPQEIHIQLDPLKLAARRLNVGDVRDAIRLRNRDVSGGDKEFGKRRYFLRTIGRFGDLEALNDLIVAQENGAHIRLRDVGHATLGTEEPRNLAFADGKPALLIGIGKRVGANVIAVKDSVLAAADELNRHALKDRGLTMRLLSEDVRYMEQSIRNVLENLVLGGGLAALVLLLFLRSLPATVIAAAGMPICVLATLLVLAAAGRSVNVISLSGIAFAIGMTLDNSIVALDNISRHLDRGKPRFAATLDGITEVWPAILSSTLTTVMVFLPVLLLDREAGQLYSDIAVAISGSIVMSMLVAMTIVPMAASRWPLAAPEPGRLGRLLDRLGAGFTGATAAGVRWVLHGLGRELAVMAAAVALVAAIIAWMVPPAEYLPEGEEATVFSFVSAPPGYSMNTMMEIWRGIDPALSGRVGAAPESGTVDGVPPLAVNLSFVRPGFMRFVTEPLSAADTQTLIKAVTEKLRAVPGMRAFAARGSIFSGNSGGSRAIKVELSGGDLRTLYATSLAVLDRAGRLFENGQVNSDPSPPTLNMSQPLLELHPDWERASELGISLTELGYALRAYADGAFADEYILNDEKLDIYLRVAADANRDRQDFENLSLYTGKGVPVPISTLAELRETVGSSSIARVDGLRTVTLTIMPPRSVALETGIALVREKLLDGLRTEGVIPDAITTRITGASGELEEIRAAMTGGFVLAAIIAYLVLVAVFAHWGYPLIIMAVVPTGISGGLLGLWLFNALGAHLDAVGLAPTQQPFDVLTMLGFLVLIGAVVNNPILIVERAAENRTRKGMAIADAVEEALRLRLRPIMISTVTTIFGLVPLVLIPSAGTELYRGLGLVVLFGMLFSSLVTITVLPVALSLVFRGSAWVRSFCPRGLPVKSAR
ncbi:efflux RND transporter permease subunit [Azospirillum doebereinerae]|uniref:efflux RND transporter permease subunit n=1 Tax=Azospirillum doebereinerae TaxID=92933 RepID=UPI001EE5BBD0|nr:efflux RND transporter permease subunit [Azospirillum doebereinerae]MCG5240286.1 efflux RND transporter permease subunit [Azospirillum doebereinerae]